jgi:hypothetical protein
MQSKINLKASQVSLLAKSNICKHECSTGGRLMALPANIRPGSSLGKTFQPSLTFESMSAALGEGSWLYQQIYQSGKVFQGGGTL